ncbi:Pheromone-processing carboxypeptidase KEX1 [Madurella mycetomatis]|uniref:Carboxypeptidase n=1 Tax=Madurella mycetomatis TaxID=100816 RepID=A0A175WH77_9PEZI|nr:Pheromone-processing carboxypeptidase KEX1 [Madurella mycetomatis]
MAVLGPSLAGWMRLPAITAALALSWTATLAVAGNTAGDYFVHSLPGAPEGPLVKMHAGHIEITPEHNGNLFFWHFQNKHIANKQRTVIWLNGGPGCSSEDGALMEIGPYRVKDPDTLVYNEGAWNEFANVLFVDNPVGTGYSYADTNAYVSELDEMAEQFIIFLEKWYALFPEYEHDDLYIAGESYAGQHIPYIAKHILARNKLDTTKHKWNLMGLLIGNGWISPPEQYDAYLQFAYQKGIVEKGSDAANKLEVQHRICQKQLAIKDGLVDNQDCEKILQDILQYTASRGGDGQLQCYNMYDVRLKDVYPSCGMNWPPDLTSVTPYLRRKEVTEALHVSPNKATGWVECNGHVHQKFNPVKSRPSIDLLPDLLTEVPIMLFSGAEDLICNHLGTEALISNMAWNGGRGFELSPGTWAPRRDWTFEGEAAGFWQEARNLTYVVFYNASHMVPFDYPRRSRDMLDRFMGVDITNIGGRPTDSRLDGEKGPETTVGGAAGNGTADQQAEKEKIDKAKWEAYRRSGFVVLVIVAVAAALWGFFVWRDRRRRQGYQGLPGGAEASPVGRAGALSSTGERGRGLPGFRSQRNRRDLEAGDFDESQLDDLTVQTPMTATATEAHEERDTRYSLGGVSDDEEDEAEKEKDKANAGSS